MVQTSYKKYCIFLFRIARILAILMSFLVIGYLGDHYYAFRGRITTHYSFTNKGDQIISSFTPGSRIDKAEKRLSDGAVYRRMHHEPVYFDVKMPRLYEKVHVSFTYDNPDQKIIELGLSKGTSDFDFDFQPLENKLIDASLDWPSLHDINEDLSLLQKKRNYTSIQDFLLNPPMDAKIALYNYSFKPDIIIPGYQPSIEHILINEPLRGAHIFYIYAKDEPIDITFSWQELNRSFDADAVTVQLWQKNNLISEDALTGDGDTTASGHLSAYKSYRLFKEGIKEGVYKIVFKATDDVVLRTIDSAQEKFVIENNIFPTAGDDITSQIPDISTHPVTLYTSGAHMQFSTPHETALQVLNVNNETVTLEKVDTPSFWDSSTTSLANSAINTIHLSEGDVKVFTNGFFAFSEESFFDPNGNITSLTSDTDVDNIDYILFSHYTSPQRGAQWTTAEAVFDIRADHIAGGDNTLHFILSAPGLNETIQPIYIHDVTVTLEKAPFSLRDILNKF